MLLTIFTFSPVAHSFGVLVGNTLSESVCGALSDTGFAARHAALALSNQRFLRDFTDRREIIQVSEISLVGMLQSGDSSSSIKYTSSLSSPWGLWCGDAVDHATRCEGYVLMKRTSDDETTAYGCVSST